mgnify:CR=1 FL=1|jgi:hypothetical protein
MLACAVYSRIRLRTECNRPLHFADTQLEGTHRALAEHSFSSLSASTAMSAKLYELTLYVQFIASQTQAM